jgi:hypothetical protein
MHKDCPTARAKQIHTFSVTQVQSSKRPRRNHCSFLADGWRRNNARSLTPSKPTGCVGAISTPSAYIKHQPNQTHDHQPIIAQVAGAKIRQTTAHTGDSSTVEAAPSAANPVKIKAAIRPLSRRRQPTGLPHPVASVIVPQPTTTQTKGSSLKPILRSRSQMLFRRSIQPKRILRIRPAKLKFIFRPTRFGVKPKIKLHECQTY